MEPVYSNLKQFMDTLLGEYTPITYVYGEDTLIPSGMAGMDWPYIIRALAFLLVFYCIFRLLGVILCK